MSVICDNFSLHESEMGNFDHQVLRIFKMALRKYQFDSDIKEIKKRVVRSYGQIS